jgi:RHS repeat-associated protein
VITAAYDGLLRLVAAREEPGAFFRYTYDLAGKRTEVWVNNTQTAALTYDAADQVLGWQYDAAGNLLSDGSHQWTYDALRRMTSMRVGAGVDVASYTYNGDGVLVREQNTWGTSAEYAVDLAAPLSQVLQTRLSGSTRNVLYGQGRLGYQESDATSWLLSDALGSVRQTADSGGSPGWGVWYDPWGQVEQGSVPTFGFASEQQDPIASQVYLRARWYAPGQGRFLSQDSYLGSLDRPDTLHLYAYVGNSPLNRTDRSGHCYGPAAFLRDWEPTNCTNLDMALRIAQHPQATALEREFAKNFIFSFVGSHAAVLIGLGIIGWQAVGTAGAAFTAMSQWGSAYLLVETSGGVLATQVARGGGVGGLPQVGGEAVGALGKAGVCTAATLTFLELLKRVFGQTRADTNTQSRRPDPVIVSH